MEKFSATVSIEELKAKAKKTTTTKSTCQWVPVYLSWAKIRNKEQEIALLSFTHGFLHFILVSGEAKSITTWKLKISLLKTAMDSPTQLFPRGSRKPGRADFVKNIEFKYQKCSKPEMIVFQWKFSELI